MNTSMVLKQLQSGSTSDAEGSQLINSLSNEEFANLLAQLLAQTAGIEQESQPSARALATIAQRSQHDVSDADDANQVALLAQIYRQLGPHNPARYHLLICLAKKQSPVSLKMLSEQLVEDPPHGAGPTSATLLPLFQLTETEQVQAIFPRILDAIANPELAAAILDLANYLTRRGRIEPHPATDRVDELNQLAEAIVALLITYQSTEAASAEELHERQEKVANGIPLAISICDSLALIGEDRTVPTLERMLELKHRRLRVEASAALVKLGQEPAIEVLTKLAAEPTVRSRVIAYADELNISNEIADEFRTPLAEAEAQLITHLSEPTNMGLPPATCELVDSRVLSWPGYEEPRNCYLFSYTYQVVDKDGQPATFSNIGIAGPVAHAFHADLCQLSHADVYAAFAGWQAEHPEITEGPLQHQDSHPKIVREFVERLESEEYEEINPLVLAKFFQDQVVVSLAKRDSVSGTVVVDEARTSWFPQSSTERPIGPAEAYSIYKGRRLLRSFNNDMWDE